MMETGFIFPLPLAQFCQILPEEHRQSQHSASLAKAYRDTVKVPIRPCSPGSACCKARPRSRGV